MAREEKQRFKRTWKLLPEPGYDTVDPADLGRELIGAQFAADRLGLATTFGPLRYIDSNGDGVTFGYEFLTVPVKAMTEAQADQIRGFAPAPDFEEAPEPEVPVAAGPTDDELEAALTGDGAQGS